MSDIRMPAAECGSCFRHCRIQPGKTGFCGARGNVDGRVICTSYGRITSLALDPIEKKPLAQFYPGSMILSLGSYGCNMDCPFCQNFSISRADESTVSWSYASPEQIADQAYLLKPEGNIGVAYTYNEALTGWEFVRDTAKEVRGRGMMNVLVTNGCFSEQVLDAVLPYIDAFNIDLKGFSNDWYSRIGGSLEMVKRFIKKACSDAHVEITTLIIPGENDSQEVMEQLSAWIAGIDSGIPLHITRFFPMYRMKDRDMTDRDVMNGLRDIARGHLRSVYLGNV